MTILERVARVMADAAVEPYAGLEGYWLGQARAALAALEVPTPEMIDAGKTARATGRGTSEQIYAAMIRKAMEG